MAKTAYVQDVADWISYYERGGVSKQDGGESTGGIGADSGSNANPVEKPVRNNNKSIETEIRQGQPASMPGQEEVQQALATTIRRRRRRKGKSSVRAKFMKKRKRLHKKVRVKRRKKKKKTKKKKKKKKKKNGKPRRRRKRKRQRDLFAE
jgi:hypothetical protein